MPKNIFKILLLTFICLFISACQHGIRSNELEYPPELDQSGIDVSTLDPAEAERRLKEINDTPYPSHTIQSGDTFRIKVYGEDDLTDGGGSNSNSMVTPDGYIVVTLLGPVHVRGLTIVEATEKITKLYQQYIRYPRVSLIPVNIIGKQATILGAIQKPGLITCSEETRISDMVALAGSFSIGLLQGDEVELADVPRSYIIRNGEILPVNFSKAIYDGDPLHNIKVFPKDIIYIARKDASRVLLMGEVKNPRWFNWSAGMTIMDLIAESGGLKDEHWKNALILRKTKAAYAGAELKVYRVNIDDLIAGRARNFQIAAEDIVYIPKDSISEYNVFIRKLLPTAQLINAFASPFYWFYRD